MAHVDIRMGIDSVRLWEVWDPTRGLGFRV